MNYIGEELERLLARVEKPARYIGGELHSVIKDPKTVDTRFGFVFPDTYEEIRALAGIGPYTAGAIASICFGLPRAAVDGNVLRIAPPLVITYEEMDQGLAVLEKVLSAF